MPGGGAASLLEASPTEDEVDIFDKSDDKEDTLGQEDGEEDRGSAEDTDKLEVEVKLGLVSASSSDASFLGLQLDSSLFCCCWGSAARLLEDIKVLITKSSNTRTIEPVHYPLPNLKKKILLILSYPIHYRFNFFWYG